MGAGVGCRAHRGHSEKGVLSLRVDWAKDLSQIFPFIKKIKAKWGCTELIEQLSNMHKVLVQPPALHKTRCGGAFL